jgi:hypothetical protein
MQYLTYQLLDGIFRALNMACAKFWEIPWPLIPALTLALDNDISVTFRSEKLIL